MFDLTDSEADLLRWLAQEDFSQFGECHGPALESLIAYGLVEVHGPGLNQGGFIAKGTSLAHSAVSLSPQGWDKLRAIGS